MKTRTSFRPLLSLSLLLASVLIGCQQATEGQGGASDRAAPVGGDLVMDDAQTIHTHGPITDEDLQEIARQRDLKRLIIEDGQFTDAGMAAISALENLEQLRIRAPQLSDESMKHIARLSSLRFLHLIDVPVTDEGIAHLSDMQQLESFYLDGGQTTDAGLQALLKALPKLHFHRNQLHLDGDPLTD